MKTLELKFEDPIERIGIAAYADETGNEEILDELRKHDYTESKFMNLVFENQDLRMQNEALKKELYDSKGKMPRQDQVSGDVSELPSGDSGESR